MPKLIDAEAVRQIVSDAYGNASSDSACLAMASVGVKLIDLPDASEPLRARIKELEGQISQAIDGLSRMIGDGICLQDGGGFFVPMYDPDGEYLGEQQLDPQHVAIMGFSMASDLLNTLKGGQDV